MVFMASTIGVSAPTVTTCDVMISCARIDARHPEFSRLPEN
jgi:hypothetical protein